MDDHGISGWLINNGLSILNSIILSGILFYFRQAIKNNFTCKTEDHKANLDIIKNKSNEFSKLEIDVIKNSWSKFIDVYYYFEDTSAALKRYPDVKLLTEDDIKLILKNNHVSDENIELVLSSHDKQEEIQDVLNFTKANITLKLLFKFTKYVDKNSIFIRKNIKTRFDILYEEMRNISFKYREYIRLKAEKTSNIYTEQYETLIKVRKLKEEAEVEIQKVIFPEKITK